MTFRWRVDGGPSLYADWGYVWHCYKYENDTFAARIQNNGRVAPLDSSAYMFEKDYEYASRIIISSNEAYEKFGEFICLINPMYSDEFPHTYQYNKYGTTYGAL